MKIKFEDADKIKNPKRFAPKKPTPIEELDKILNLKEQLAKIEPPEEILADVKQPEVKHVPCIAYDFSGFKKYRVHNGEKKGKIQDLTTDFLPIFNSLSIQPGFIIEFNPPKNKSLIEFHIHDVCITFNTVGINANRNRCYQNVFIMASDPQHEQIKKLIGA